MPEQAIPNNQAFATVAKYAGQPEVADEQADPIDLTSLAVSPTESLVVSAN